MGFHGNVCIMTRLSGVMEGGELGELWSIRGHVLLSSPIFSSSTPLSSPLSSSLLSAPLLLSSLLLSPLLSLLFFSFPILASHLSTPPLFSPLFSSFPLLSSLLFASFLLFSILLSSLPSHLLLSSPSPLYAIILPSSSLRCEYYKLVLKQAVQESRTFYFKGSSNVSEYF